MNYGTPINVMDNDEMIKMVQYAPNGADHLLQKRITELLHQIVMADGRLTLAELGYLHMNTLTYSPERGIDLRIYFDARLACRVLESKVNQNKYAIPVMELGIFENYLYVGSYKDVVTYETIMAPKVKIVRDELDRRSVKIKDNGSNYGELSVVVLHCNLAITMAAVHGINLWDPKFTVKCGTVGRGAKKKSQAIVTTGNGEVPVSVVVTQSVMDDYGTYSPEDAVPYLQNLAEKAKNAAKNQRKLEEKVAKKAKSKKAKKQVKKSQRSTNMANNDKAFNKYS